MDKDKQTIKVVLTNRTIIRVIVIILLSLIALKFIVKVDHILELVFLSFFLGIALNPTVSMFARGLKLKSRAAATLIAYLMVVVILSGFLALIVPPLYSQTKTFISNLPSNIASLKNPNTAAGRFVKNYNLTNQVNNLTNEVSHHTSNLADPVLSTATKIGQVIADTLIVLVLTFMMIVEGPSWIKTYERLRFKKHDWHAQVAKKMYRIVTGYVNGQLLLALLAGVVTLISLEIVTNILNVNINVIALSALMILTALIPMIGHIIGGAIVVVACLFVSWPLALIMGIILLVYLELASVTIQPYIQSKYNELSPMLVLIAALIGISAAGILGAFVAIPIAGCMKVALKEYLSQRKLIAD